MEIIRLPVLSDNYVFLLHDPEQNIAAVVDPAVAEPVLAKLAELNAKLVAIFNTHHHGDHVGGNQELKRKFPDLVVYGGVQDQGRIPEQQVFLQGGDRVEFAQQTGEVFFVPGHTRAHIAYYFPPTTADQPGELFCGDTLFAGGCGRLLEGTADLMVTSLNKLRMLPDNTRVWCAHEYTLANLRFALTVDADNLDLQERFVQVKDSRHRLEPTVPSLLGIEKRTNPFLRWDQPALQAVAKTQDAVETFAQIRLLKDNF
jgi:hydroxyacylglutathione hydrolase